MSRCNHFLSSSNGTNIVPDGDVVQCLLKQDHEENHLCQVKWFEVIEYFSWLYDEDCGCSGPDWCGCIVYNTITKSEAEQIIKEIGFSS